MALNLRIFRRNQKSLIFLWSSTGIPDSPKVAAFIVEEGAADRPLKFTKFIPDQPSKFSCDVDGIVISHQDNAMDAGRQYSIKLSFGAGGREGFEFIKQVKPANAAPEPVLQKDQRVVHVYGMNYSTGKWVPFPVDSRLILDREE